MEAEWVLAVDCLAQIWIRYFRVCMHKRSYVATDFPSFADKKIHAFSRSTKRSFRFLRALITRCTARMRRGIPWRNREDRRWRQRSFPTGPATNPVTLLTRNRCSITAQYPCADLCMIVWESRDQLPVFHYAHHMKSRKRANHVLRLFTVNR